MITVACLEQGLELSARCAIIIVTGFFLVFFWLSFKAVIVPADQGLQGQIPRGAGG